MILDTCALLWLAEGSKELSSKARTMIDKAPQVYVSATSGFEVNLKVKSGKLKLPAEPAEWFRQVIEHHDLSVVQLDLDTCIQAVDLPAIHKDPCDRFIIAAARLNDWPVVTSDPIFKEYGVETFC